MKAENCEPQKAGEEKGCAMEEAPFCPAKTAEPTKLSGREGARSRGSFPVTIPGFAAPLPRKPLRPRLGGLLRAIVKPLRHAGRRARFHSALPRRGGHPTWEVCPGPARASSRAAQARCAAGRVLPRAPTPPQLQAEGRVGAGLRVRVRGRRPQAGREAGAVRRPGRGAASGRTMWRRRRLMGARHHGGAQ